MNETKKAKFQVNDYIRVADLRKNSFSKGDTTNWSYNLYEITEVVNNTIPSNKIDQLPDRYDEALLKKTELNMKKNDSVMKKLQITQIKMSLPN